jgi:hypothetical protein
MFQIHLQPAPSGNPTVTVETAQEVAIYLEEWCRNEAEHPSGLCPCVAWHDCGTEAIPFGTIS